MVLTIVCAKASMNSHLYVTSFFDAFRCLFSATKKSHFFVPQRSLLSAPFCVDQNSSFRVSVSQPVCLSVCLSLSLTPSDTNCLLVLLHLSQGPFVGRYVSHQHFLGPKDPLSVCVISSFSVVISFCPIV